mgnify:FL=1
MSRYDFFVGLCGDELTMQMQSLSKAAAEHRPAKPSILNTAAYIYKESGIRGLYRGVSPRICLGIWQTVCIHEEARGWCANICRCVWSRLPILCAIGSARASRRRLITIHSASDSWVCL